MKKLYPLMILLSLLFSCQRTIGPEEALREYVNYRFSDGQTRVGILEKTANLLQESVRQMSDEELERFTNLKKYKKKKLKINLQKCDPKKCFITYTITYDQLENDNKAFEVEAKKIAELHYVDGGWKIADVNNVKTYLEGQEEISP